MTDLVTPPAADVPLPLAVVGPTALAVNVPLSLAVDPWAAAALAAAFGAGAVWLRALTPGGAALAAGLGWTLLALGGPAWTAPGLAFFVLSSALSRVGRRRKRASAALAAKGGRRDAAQVAANGGAAALALLAHAAVPEPALYGAFLGAFAAAAADTWGTEVGTWAGGPTRVLGVGRRVPPGTSGGVSAWGTAASGLGAASVVGAAAVLGAVGLADGLALVAVGVGAAALDSALGATVQARYGPGLSERPDGAPPARGVRWMTNDAVNAACTLAGALGGAAAVWAVG